MVSKLLMCLIGNLEPKLSAALLQGYFINHKNDGYQEAIDNVGNLTEMLELTLNEQGNGQN